MQHGNLFTGTLVRLAAFDEAVKSAMARWTNDAEYRRQMDDEPARPLSDKALAEQEKEFENNPEVLNFSVRALADDTLIGFCGGWATWTHQTIKVWIGIGEPEYRGRGYGSDAMRLLVAYSFRELGLYRVGLTVYSYNTRAIRAYEKVGFVREQVLRAALYRDGQRFDIITMSILRPEWEQRMASAQ